MSMNVASYAVWILNVLVDATGHHGEAQAADQSSGLVDLHSRKWKGRAANGDQPVGAASCRREQQIQGDMLPPPPPVVVGGSTQRLGGSSRPRQVLAREGLIKKSIDAASCQECSNIARRCANPTPALKDWAKISFGPSANQKISLAD